MLAFLLTLLILITFHEFGHFWVARKLGVKVLTFSVGFGKPLLKWQGRDGVQYQISWIPLGGYVRMLDGRAGHVPPEQQSVAFDTQPVWKRFLIVLAGPLANLLLAWLLYTVIFISGLTAHKALVDSVLENSAAESLSIPAPSQIISVGDNEAKSWESVSYHLLKFIHRNEAPVVFETEDSVQHRVLLPTDKLSSFAHPMMYLRDLGLQQKRPTIASTVGGVVSGGAADKAGLKAGDVVTAIDGQNVSDWETLVRLVRDNPGRSVEFEVLRGESMIRLLVTPRAKEVGNDVHGVIGVRVATAQLPEEYLHTEQYPLGRAVARAWNEMLDKTILTLAMFKNMLLGLVSSESLGGPVAIAQGATSALDSGTVAFLSYLALISISLGVFLIGITVFALLNDLGRLGLF